ncbi:hypothetical protein D0C27_06400 [Alcaligenes faecalis]|nr:hypothetical protein D0C27_06400 [Alcaligenes faecalis]
MLISAGSLWAGFVVLRCVVVRWGEVFDRSGGVTQVIVVFLGGDEAVALSAFIPNLRRKKMVFRRIENRVSILVL